ncbi:TPA: hypothetical protein QDZ75_001641 [Stenotrophomonas maltophilia]|nr:hypothetical protein [Stenotrophomonas maltophilia]
MSYRPFDPIACDCCLHPLRTMQFGYHRMTTMRAGVELPYVICSTCARDESLDGTEWIDRFLLRRAGRISACWQAAVRELLEVIR